jgi:uncharacterized damage-inducible protein DinB
MKKFVSLSLGMCCIFVLFTCSLFGSGNLTTKSDNTSAFIQDYIGQMDFVQGRILQLEDAMPQEKFEWRPMEGVRSVAEVYLHIAEGNMLLVSTVSGTKSDMEIDDKITDKSKIAAIVKSSFEAVKEGVSKVSDEDLNKVIKTPFGMDMSLRNFMFTMLNHAHEHLGQSIAYARMNKIVPPWSMPSEQK